MRASSNRVLSRTLKLASSAGAIAAVLALAGTAWTQEGPNKDEVFSLNRTVTITGPTSGTALVSFDISWFDPGPQSILLGRSQQQSRRRHHPSQHVDQFTPGFVGARGKDPVTHAVCGPPTNSTTCISNNDVSGPDGVLTSSTRTELWVGDGDSRVWVLNPTTGTALTLPGGASNPILTSPASDNNHNRADELCYDSADQLVMVANNADDPPFASIISTQWPLRLQSRSKIVFDGTNNAPKSNNGAEQCQWSPRTGKFYISIPGIVGRTSTEEGGVAVIDPKTKMVEKTFLIDGNDCIAPQGMAVGPDSQILLGCNQPSPEWALEHRYHQRA